MSLGALGRTGWAPLGPSSYVGKTGREKGSSGGGKVKDNSPERINCSEDDTGLLEPFYLLENRKTALLMSLLCTHPSEIQS